MSSTSAPARQHYNVTLAVLALGALSYALLQTMVAPALPEIQHELGATPTQVTWVLTVYLLSASIATPILGRLGDMFGKERMLVVVLGLFAVGSVICALSSSLALLVAGRAVQGAAGAVFPLAFGIIRDEFPRERVATGIGLISATFGIGGGAGLVLSGLIVDHLSYRWIFWFGLVVVIIATVATHLCGAGVAREIPGSGGLRRGSAPVRRPHRAPPRRERGQPLGLGLRADRRPPGGCGRAARGVGLVRAARPGAAGRHSTCFGCAACGPRTSRAS